MANQHAHSSPHSLLNDVRCVLDLGGSAQQLGRKGKSRETALRGEPLLLNHWIMSDYTIGESGR